MRVRRMAVAAVALAAAVAAALFWPYQGFRGEAYVEIAPGTPASEMARALASAGVLRWETPFLLARCMRPRATLQAGEYRFDKPASVWEVYRRLAAGDVFYRKLLVREGDNLFDIAASLDRMGLMRGADFLAVARDPSLIRDLAPEAPTLEGYLFPAVYPVSRGTTPRDLCLRMTGKFRSVWAGLGAPGGVHAAVTLASLVEKETALPEERPLVASVFLNRLRKGMPLDCDPTVIYAAVTEGRYSGVISQSDLLSRNRYNTYQFPGLPPGPIASPGLESLKAALRPAETNYLYFVLKPDGSGAHVFSAGLDSHARAVSRYRSINGKNQQTRPPQAVSGGTASRSHR